MPKSTTPRRSPRLAAARAAATARARTNLTTANTNPNPSSTTPAAVPGTSSDLNQVYVAPNSLSSADIAAVSRERPGLLREWRRVRVATLHEIRRRQSSYAHEDAAMPKMFGEWLLWRSDALFDVGTALGVPDERFDAAERRLSAQHVAMLRDWQEKQVERRRIQREWLEEDWRNFWSFFGDFDAVVRYLPLD